MPNFPEGRYEDSYKVVAFISILGFLRPIGAAMISLGDYLDKIVDVTSGYAYLILAVPIIFLLFKLWIIVILITGVKEVYDMKTKEAFLSVASFWALLFFMMSVLKPAYFPEMSNAVVAGLSVLIILILPKAGKMLKKASGE